MAINCCDPKALPKCDDPNCLTLMAGSWIPIDVRQPSLLIVKGTSLGNYDKGPRFRYMIGRRPPTYAGKSCQYTMQGPSIFLGSPGTWWVTHDSTESIDVNVISAYDASMFMAFNRSGYGHAEHTAPTVGIGNTLVVAANLDRNYLMIINDSVNVVYLSFGVAAVLNAGIRLNANGGSYEMGGASNWRGAVWGISSAPSVVLVTEGS